MTKPAMIQSESEPAYNRAAVMFEEADLIYAYSREDALNDGVLIDITASASKLGFHAHTAMTHGVSTEVVDGSLGGLTTPAIRMQRVQHLLLSALDAIRRCNKRGDSTVFFDAYGVNCKLMIGPGDRGEPVFTVLLANED